MSSPDPIREQSLERSLPNSAEAERAILGGVILDNALIAQCIELLRPEDFYVPSHKRIFLAMTAIFERGGEINPILIGEELKKENALESVGGISFITNLTYGLPHSTNIAHYAKVVRGKSMMRQLIRAANKITQEALEGADDPETILDHAEAAIFELSDERTREGFVHVKPTAMGVLEKIQEQEGRASVLTGIATKFTDLDTLTSGLQKKDLIIVAARPSTGKTSFALMLAEHAAQDGLTVGIFSLEMSKEALVMRMLCGNANIDAQRFRNGFLSKQEWTAMGSSLNELADWRIFIDDMAGLNPLELRAKARRLATEQKALDLIIVDYLGLMTGSSSRFESRQQEVASNARALKQIAKEMNVPLVCLCQLSRAPEKRADNRPQLSDLRDSGEIEEVADVVAFLHREDRYMSPDQREGSDELNIVQVIVAKQRNGPTDVVKLRFTPSSMRLDNMWKE